MCHSHTARATRAAVTSSQKTQTETQPDRIKTESLAMLMSRHIAENNSAPSGVSGQSQMYLYLFSHFEQGQLSQGNQEMELMAWLFSTSFLNDTEAI